MGQCGRGMRSGPTSSFASWPSAAFSTTTPYGNTEKHFDPSALAAASGASYVARSTVYHATAMEKLIGEAISHRGFSLVEAVANCHTYFGRLNRKGDAVAMLNAFKANTVTLSKSKTMSQEELDGKWVIGTFHEDNDKSEFCDEYQKVVDAHLGEK